MAGWLAVGHVDGAPRLTGEPSVVRLWPADVGGGRGAFDDELAQLLHAVRKWNLVHAGLQQKWI